LDGKSHFRTDLRIDKKLHGTGQTRAACFLQLLLLEDVHFSYNLNSLNIAHSRQHVDLTILITDDVDDELGVFHGSNEEGVARGGLCFHEIFGYFAGKSWQAFGCRDIVFRVSGIAFWGFSGRVKLDIEFVCFVVGIGHTDVADFTAFHDYIQQLLAG
jgi:hypothetical protein